MSSLYERDDPLPTNNVWIVPSNPRTFDTEAAFAAMSVLDWTETAQSKAIALAVCYRRGFDGLAAFAQKPDTTS